MIYFFGRMRFNKKIMIDFHFFSLLKINHHIVIMSESESYKALTSIVVLTTLVSSFVLSKRLEKCVPKENDHQKRSRVGVMWLSGLALALALYKAFSVSVPKLKIAKLPVDALYNVMALVVVILNLAYISTLGSDMCTNHPAAGEVTINDLVANKNLMVSVLVLSAVSLLLILKRSLWWLGVFVGKKNVPALPVDLP